MKLINNDEPPKVFVSVSKLIFQLQNGKVLLERLPPVNLNISASITNVTGNKDADETNDEYFFKEPGKKRALGLSKPYCRKCNKTVDNATTRDKNCPNCDTQLFFKCMKCNMQYANYSSMCYHSRSQCFPKNTLRCPKCPYSTTVPQLLGRHVANLHRNFPSLKIKECPDCGKLYKLIKLHKQICRLNNRELDKGQLNNLNDDCDKENDTGNTSPTGTDKISSNSNQTSEKKPEQNDSSSSFYTVIPNKTGHSKIVKRCCPKCNKFKSIKFLKTPEKCDNCDIDMILQCMKCEKRYLNPESIKYHVQSKCGPSARYQCIKCEYVTTIEGSIKKHVKRMHTIVEPTSFEKCTICKRSFRDRSSLKQHMKYCGKIPNLACIYCPYKSAYRQNLRAHLRKVHLNLSVSDVEIAFNKGMNYKIKVKSTAELNNQTSETVNSKANIRNFIKNICLNCNKEVKDYTSKTCSKCDLNLVLKCRKCDKVCETLKGLRSHTRHKHKVQELNSLICKKCKKVTKDSRSLKYHFKFCGLEANLKCEFCSYMTKYPSNLNSHKLRCQPIRKKIKIERYSKAVDSNNCIQSICSKCNETKRATRLTKCLGCKTKLSFKCLLCTEDTCIHLRIHEKNVRFICSSCQKGFAEYKNLYCHKTFCTRSAIFHCRFCDFKSKFKANAERHEKTIHPKGF